MTNNVCVFILGSYDHTLKLFDARVDKSVMTMDHGQPVESLLLYPSEGLLVSAGSYHQVQSACPENANLLSDQTQFLLTVSNDFNLFGGPSASYRKC